eukprot:TRINITY_DN434_c1_g4_i1.p1 TRINITY_DN434_c1_g4~~TRINITY_DN434_c1_g4_i1.p1  ORF type:complete len:294 (+),score=125.76 TRINITY_DN434_c1_g4_i1:71-952(+)
MGRGAKNVGGCPFFYWPSFLLSRISFVLTHVTFAYFLLFILNDPLQLLPKALFPLMDVRAEDVRGEGACTPVNWDAVKNNALWFGAWWATHSLPSRSLFKKYVLGTLNDKGEIHPIDRPGFAIVAPVMWFLTMYKWVPVSDCARFDPLAVSPAVWAVSGSVIVGALVLVLSLLYMLPSHVFGTDRHLYPQGEYPHGKLITGHPYGLVAHPAAAGFLWVWWALPAYTANHIQLVAMWTTFIVLGTVLEEAGLNGESEFGIVYGRYRAKVSGFFPTVWSIRNTLGLKNEELHLYD